MGIAMRQMDFLGDEKTFDRTVEQIVDEAVAVILSLLRSGTILHVSFSGGKDSAVVANLSLVAAVQAVREGLTPRIIVTSSDTLVESPEVVRHVKTELAKMRAYGKQRGVDIQTHIVNPTLLSTWQVKVLSGRGLPSYSGTNTDCSVDLKIKPQLAFRKRLLASLRDTAEPVTLLGTRYAESERRAVKMRDRQESHTTPVRNATGDLVLSPIAFWSTDEVWEYIGQAANGLADTFSDFAETKRIYAHAGGASCAVVADTLQAGKVKKGGCGARLGCFICQQSEDKSLEAMIKFDQRYSYATGLNRLNKFIRAIRHDWTRRNWVGRTIKAGYIAIEPDTFSPATVRELFRYMLQLDFDEIKRAESKGESPMFQVLSYEMILAIDAMWSLNGLAEPFAAWYDWADVFQNGIRYDIPEMDVVKETPIPATRFLHVGSEWDDLAHHGSWSGLRDAYFEAMTERSCAPELKEMPNGKMGWDTKTEQRFSIDAESLCMFLDFELPDILSNRKPMLERIVGGITQGYKWYFNYGILTLSHGLRTEHDHKLRRTAFKDRENLTLSYDHEALIAKTISFADLPPNARAVWACKSRADTAQTELPLAA